MRSIVNSRLSVRNVFDGIVRKEGIFKKVVHEHGRVEDSGSIVIFRKTAPNFRLDINYRSAKVPWPLTRTWTAVSLFCSQVISCDSILP